jgi:hypothetical protein
MERFGAVNSCLHGAARLNGLLGSDNFGSQAGKQQSGNRVARHWASCLKSGARTHSAVAKFRQLAISLTMKSRVVQRDGNRVAQDLVNKVFEVCDRKWRGVGSIPKSGYKLQYEFRDHDAERLFEVEEIDTQEPAVCISGLRCGRGHGDGLQHEREVP